MNYYDEIKDKLIKSELYDKVKDYSKDRNKVKVYLEIGKLLKEAGKEYGKNIIKQYADKLTLEVGKKYNERTLRYMRQLYDIIEISKWNTVCSKLSWSHYREILSIKNIDEIIYYLNECESKCFSQREFHNFIKQNNYNRLSIESRSKILNNVALNITDFIPNPLLIRSSNIENYNEYCLKESILNNLDDFLLQLGFGFSYIGNEYRIKLGDTYNYIDLLLFNYEFNCFVVIELKITELKKEHIGQIQVYMNYIDRNLKKINQDKTIGIIICKKDNKYVIEYSSDSRIITREYKLIC